MYVKILLFVILIIFIFSCENNDTPTPVFSVNIKDITASSFLKDEKDYFRYHAIRALDFSALTSWVEGVAGSGINEFLFIEFSEVVTIDKLKIMPGYFDEQWYNQNNRIKKLTLFLDDYSLPVTLSDGMESKEIILPQAKSFTNMMIQIEEVYRGDSYDDTCIAEIQLFYKDKEIELICDNSVSAIAKRISPKGKFIYVTNMMMGGFRSEYFFEDGFYLRYICPWSIFEKYFGTWQIKKNSTDIEIHLTSKGYLNGIGNSIVGQITLYEDYEYLEEEIDIHETTDWDYYISSAIYIVDDLTPSIHQITAEDYQKKQKDYTMDIENNRVSLISKYWEVEGIK